jgi:hypothetical protein
MVYRAPSEQRGQVDPSPTEGASSDGRRDFEPVGSLIGCRASLVCVCDSRSAAAQSFVAVIVRDCSEIDDLPTTYAVPWVTPAHGWDAPGTPLAQGVEPDPLRHRLEFRDVCGNVEGLSGDAIGSLVAD